MQKKDRDLPKSSYRHVTTRTHTSNSSKYVHKKSTSHRLYPFFEGNKDLSEKIMEDMFYKSSKLFTQKAIVDEMNILNSSKVCKKIVGIDASQLYSFSGCQEMLTKLYTI